MRKIIARVAIALVIVCVLATSVASPAQAMCKYRTQCGKVFCIYGCEDTEDMYEITFKTNDGNYWVWYTDNTIYYPNQRVIIRFNTKGTQKKSDDIIVSIRWTK